MSTRRASSQNDSAVAITSLVGRADLGHHAVALEGEVQSVYQEACDIMQRSGFDVHGNPDLYTIETDVITIEDVRTVRALSASRPSSGGVRLFVFVTRDITHEAQNAILKLLEDPPPDVRFLIIIPRSDILLPTVRSRLLIVSDGNARTSDASLQAGIDFLAATPPERLKVVAPLIEEKDRMRLNELLDGIEAALATRVHGHWDESLRAVLHDVDDVRSLAHARSASVKFLATHLVAILPVLTLRE